jgi:hypothetical protein
LNTWDCRPYLTEASGLSFLRAPLPATASSTLPSIARHHHSSPCTTAHRPTPPLIALHRWPSPASPDVSPHRQASLRIVVHCPGSPAIASYRAASHRPASAATARLGQPSPRITSIARMVGHRQPLPCIGVYRLESQCITRYRECVLS